MCPAKLFFKSKGEIKTFSDLEKKKLSKFIASRPEVL